MIPRWANAPTRSRNSSKLVAATNGAIIKNCIVLSLNYCSFMDVVRSTMCLKTRVNSAVPQTAATICNLSRSARENATQQPPQQQFKILLAYHHRDASALGERTHSEQELVKTGSGCKRCDDYKIFLLNLYGHCVILCATRDMSEHQSQSGGVASNRCDSLVTHPRAGTTHAESGGGNKRR